MDIETAKRHASIAFDLMVGLRHNQGSQAYIHAAKACMALDAEVKRLQREQKKKAPDITEAEVDALAALAGLPKVETPNTEPAPPLETTDKVLKRVGVK